MAATHIIVIMASKEQSPGCRRDQLFCTLRHLGITTETFPYVEHPSESASKKQPFRKGIFCKNLFLKDRRGQFYLVIIPEHENVDLKYLKKCVGAYRNFSFGSADDLMLLLGAEAGIVSPFGMMCDTSHRVRIIIDSSLAHSHLLLNFHPFVPWLTTVIKFCDLCKFVSFCGCELENVNLCD